MAHADNSAFLRKLRGMLGKELVFRDWDGKTVVSKAPKRKNKKSTPEQENTRIRFKYGSRYANFVTRSTDKSLAEAYALVLKPRQNVHSRALQDFINAPKIKFIRTEDYKGEIGDKIVVRAIDDFRVLNVLVEIYTPDGNLLEAGLAAQNVNGIDWTYPVTKTNKLYQGGKIKVIATDVPNNEEILEVKI